MIAFNKYYNHFNIVSTFLIVVSLVLLIFKGLNFGIDFKGGTLIAAIILFFMGSGPIKGFAVTLAVGIFTTLFSVYFIARLLTAIYVSRNKNKERLI